MTLEELADLLASSYSLDGWSDLSIRPLLAVLDTSCVRTGLRHQLQHGSAPLSLSTARDGSVRLFMEYETLAETGRKLSKFAKDLGVTTADLARTFDEDWLPHITVVRLPPELRQLDQRAAQVRTLDADDYPAAALAALLSPCVLLTHNFKDFGPLGMKSWSQGPDAIAAGIDLHVGQLHLNAVVMAPAAPVMAVGAAAKWASEKIGPWAWVLLGLSFTHVWFPGHALGHGIRPCSENLRCPMNRSPHSNSQTCLTNLSGHPWRACEHTCVPMTTRSSTRSAAAASCWASTIVCGSRRKRLQHLNVPSLGLSFLNGPCASSTDRALQGFAKI